MKYPTQDGFYRFMRDLNAVYLSHPALFAQDYEENGFSWIDCPQEEKRVYAISRKSGEEELLAVFNFSSKEQDDLLPEKSGCKLPVHTETAQFGGRADPPAPPELKLAPFSGVLFLAENGAGDQ